MANYEVNGVQIGVALLSNPELFAKYFVDYIDAKTNAGIMEPLADSAKPLIAEQLAQFLAEIPQALTQVKFICEE
jgi:hypothetical protein